MPPTPAPLPRPNTPTLTLSLSRAPIPGAPSNHSLAGAHDRWYRHSGGRPASKVLSLPPASKVLSFSLTLPLSLSLPPKTQASYPADPPPLATPATSLSLFLPQARFSHSLSLTLPLSLSLPLSHSMRLRDLCFFYHSGPKARRIVGVVSVVREWYLDVEDREDSGAVDVRAVGEMRPAVDLKEMKGDGGLKGFGLFRQPRLSVVPVPKDLWDRICELGGGFGEDDENGDDGDEG